MFKKLTAFLLGAVVVTQLAPPVQANPAAAASAAAAAARARIVQQQAANARNIAVAADRSRRAYAAEQAAARSRAVFEQSARNQAATRQTEMMKAIASNAAANRQRLATQSHIQKQVSAAQRVAPAKPTAPIAQFNANANPGIVYKRTTGGDRFYVGQTMSMQRYPVRQAEHARSLGAQSSYQMLGGAPGGDPRLLRVAEQAAYDAQSKFGVTLTNKVRPMAAAKYASATTP